MAKLRSDFAPGTPINETTASVDASVRKAFSDSPCQGLEYAGEQARLVYAGARKVMPGAGE